jgi:DNA-binding response OmpR family regulator
MEYHILREIMNGQKKRIKVLIVDDEECIRECISDMLNERGFITETASNGKEALERVAQDKPDIIILDVTMPLMNGLQVCRQLKENPKQQTIPIIVFSAQERIEYLFQGMPGATIKYVEKSCDLEYLVAQINNLIA